MQWITATKVGIISASLPMFIFLLSWLMGVERIGRNKVLGLVLSISGVALVIIAGGKADSGILSALTPGDALISHLNYGVRILFGFSQASAQ